MLGCLTAPFRLLGCLILVAALAAGWLYRDRIAGEARRLLGGSRPAASEAPATGRPGERALKSARAKIDSMNGWRTDSVVLTPSELASLVGNGLDQAVRRQLDSMTVRLLDGEIEIAARLSTRRLPRELVGPFGAALRDHEPIEAAGPVVVARAGIAEWRVSRGRIRDFPIPVDAIPRLLERGIGDAGGALTIKLPEGVRSIRITPNRATLYGAEPR